MSSASSASAAGGSPPVDAVVSDGWTPQYRDAVSPPLPPISFRGSPGGAKLLNTVHVCFGTRVPRSMTISVHTLRPDT